VRNAENAEQTRVAAAYGHITAPMPTPTNQATGIMERIGRAFGIGGLSAPAPQSGGGSRGSVN
jgi:hypothetical protein